MVHAIDESKVAGVVDVDVALFQKAIHDLRGESEPITNGMNFVHLFAQRSSANDREYKTHLTFTFESLPRCAFQINKCGGVEVDQVLWHL